MNRITVDSADSTARNELAGESLPQGEEIAIGKYFPFNTVYFQLEKASETPLDFVVEYWDGTKWVTLDQITDETLGFSRSGHVTVILDDRQMKRMEAIDDRYFVRVIFPIVPEITIKRIGDALTDAASLKRVFMNVDNYLATFGVNDWSEQIFLGTSNTIDYLKINGIIRSREQLLNAREWFSTVAYEVCANIFENLGGEYLERVESMRAKFRMLVKQRGKTIDRDGDGRVDRQEISGVTVNYLKR